MLYVDENGLPVDETYDGGDSSMRVGIGSITGLMDPRLCLKYILSNGEFVRHPGNGTWSNPKNFTRDQILCLAAGLSMTKEGQEAVRRNFWNRLKSFFFTQSTERDVVGSTKYLWPHEFWKDSNPNNTTIKLKFNESFGFDPSYLHSLALANGKTIERKYFDAADPLLPHHIWHMIVAGRMWYLYWFAPVGIAFYLIDSYFHYFHKTNMEENQHFAMTWVQGKWALDLWAKYNVYWENISFAYWSGRNETEYHDATVKTVKG